MSGHLVKVDGQTVGLKFDKVVFGSNFYWYHRVGIISILYNQSK